jgi:hypothetical protein
MKNYTVLAHFWMKDFDKKLVLVFWLGHREIKGQVAWVIHSDAVFHGKHYLSVKRFTVINRKTNETETIFDINKPN